jgi:aminomethyltransferase
MPVLYEGVNAEHETVRNGVGVFDVSHMGEFLLSGKCVGFDSKSNVK